MATKIDWAWFAGWFEGEGCIELTGKNSVRLAATSTDLDVLERVQAIAGGTIVPMRNAGGGGDGYVRKPKWQWYVAHSESVRPILEHLNPYLLSRRLARLEEAKRRLQGVRKHKFYRKRVAKEAAC